MHKTTTIAFWPRHLLSTLIVGLGLLGSTLSAQTRQITYKLDDVWLKPDISHPREAARQMTGTFVWTYTAGQFESGTGCTGSGGPLTLGGMGLPTLGNQGFGFTVANAPSQSSALLLLAAGQLKTPIPLNGTCLLYVDPLTLALVLPAQASKAGVARWSLPIPKTSSHLGLQFDTQALVVTTRLKLLTSNALRSTIGN